MKFTGGAAVFPERNQRLASQISVFLPCSSGLIIDSIVQVDNTIVVTTRAGI
jgi:hypothetical protein